MARPLLVPLLAAVVLVPVGGASHGFGPDPACNPVEHAHSYVGSGSTLSGHWHLNRQFSASTATWSDGNAQDCDPQGLPGTGGYGYPWNPAPGVGWNDGAAGESDFESEYGQGGGFFPGGAWASDADCDYGFVPHHTAAAPQIEDFGNSNSPPPAFLFGAADTTLSGAGVGKFSIPQPGDADGLVCLTDGAITPDTDPDDWLVLCYGQSPATVCGWTNNLNTYPDAGGDGGFQAITVSGTAYDSGAFDWYWHPVYGSFRDDHGGYHPACDPTGPSWVPGLPCHAPFVETYAVTQGYIRAP